MAFGNILGMGINLLARGNQNSPTAGSLWKGTPVSDFFVGPKPAYASGPVPQVQGTTTGPINGPFQTGPVNGPWQNSAGSVVSGNNTPTSNTNAPSGPGEPDLNRIYDPTNNFLNQMEQEYTAQQPQAEAQVNTSFEQAKTPYKQASETQLAGLNTQEGKVNMTEQNAMAQARQMFNELSQRNISMFGSGSSAGPAAQELLSRQISGQMGQAGATAGQTRTDIEGERTRVKTFLQTKMAELETNKQDAIRGLQAEFRQGLLRINQARAQNESAKASARFELLQQAQQQAYQIQQADQAYRQAIGMWEQQKTANVASVNSLQAQNLAPNIIAQIQKIGALPIPSAQKNALLQQVPGYGQFIGTQLGGNGLDFQDKQDQQGQDLTY